MHKAARELEFKSATHKLTCKTTVLLTVGNRRTFVSVLFILYVWALFFFVVSFTMFFSPSSGIVYLLGICLWFHRIRTLFHIVQRNLMDCFARDPHCMQNSIHFYWMDGEVMENKKQMISQLNLFLSLWGKDFRLFFARKNDRILGLSLLTMYTALMDIIVFTVYINRQALSY